MPIEVLGQLEVMFVNQLTQEFELVRGPSRGSLVKRTPDLDHKAAVGSQSLAHVISEFSKPFNVVSFPVRAVLFLVSQIERW